MTGLLLWRHNRCDGVSNHQPHHCLLNRLFRCKSTKTSKLRDTGLCAGNSPVTGEFPAQMASNAENVSIWWRHHEVFFFFSDEPVVVNISLYITNMVDLMEADMVSEHNMTTMVQTS